MLNIYECMCMYVCTYVCMYVVSALETEIDILKQKNERDSLAWKVDLTELQALVAEKIKELDSAHETSKDISHQVRLNIHTYIHTYIQTSISTYLSTYCTYIHTYKHIYLHTCMRYFFSNKTKDEVIHINIHTYIQTNRFEQLKSALDSNERLQKENNRMELFVKSCNISHILEEIEKAKTLNVCLFVCMYVCIRLFSLTMATTYSKSKQTK